MRHNIILTVGPRACGKSEAIEKQLSFYENKLYVATLWCAPEYKMSLYEHKQRRKNSEYEWKLYEVNGNLREDYHNINHILSDMPQPFACMIDGLTTWALNCSLKQNSLSICAYNIVFFIEKLITNHPNCLWQLVDVTPQAFNPVENKSIFDACCTIHLLLKKNIKNLKIVDWGGY
jgi:adenosyl cobinamide kinase/adenosyl cobinamide phosphate guanylyltransferase